MPERHRLHDLACLGLRRLADIRQERRVLDGAARALERLATLQPFDEDVHRRLMELDICRGVAATPCAATARCAPGSARPSATSRNSRRGPRAAAAVAPSLAIARTAFRIGCGRRGKQAAVAFHRGTLAAGMRAAIEAIKRGYAPMIDAWRTR